MNNLKVKLKNPNYSSIRKNNIFRNIFNKKDSRLVQYYKKINESN